MIQSLKMALKSVGANKLRAFLTMLGIIIGVMALVILVSLVSGATGSVRSTIDRLGTDSLRVTISDSKSSPLTLDVLNEWMQDGAIGALSAGASESGTAKVGSETSSVTVYGTTPYYQDTQGMNLLLGRFLKQADLDNHTLVCVIDESTAEELIGYKDCLDETITIDGLPFTVVGVLEDDEDTLTGMFSRGTLLVYVPYTTLVRMSDSTTLELTSLVATPSETATMDEAEAAITEKLMARFEQDDDAFSVSSSKSLEDAMSSVTSTLAILLGGIAAISLIVGGIGIMNIMLVTVTERTREIGIRKAIGATRGAILGQFLLEAVVLCMIGCIAGIFLSWAALKVIGLVVSSLELTFSLNAGVVLIAVAFCFLIGLIFGLYPANKAAKMAPIDALHYDG